MEKIGDTLANELTHRYTD